MIRAKLTQNPKRKTKNVLQWLGYIKSKLRESRGFKKHKTP